MMELLKTPKCPLCGSILEPSGKYWVCPRDNFFFNVSRGVPGRPMWTQPGEEAMPTAPQPVKEETFESFLAEHGVTKEMYKDQDDKTKEELKVAFYQRGRKDADAVLLPPQ